jgi:hypothetical protein
LQPVYIAGEAQPAFLISIPALRPDRTDARTRRETSPESARRRQHLDPRESHCGRRPRRDAYIGLRIAEGNVAFEPQPIDADGKLTIPADGQCTIQLTLTSRRQNQPRSRRRETMRPTQR